MLHAHRRYAIVLVGFFLLSGIVLAEVLLRYQYQNAHRKMALRYQIASCVPCGRLIHD